MRELYLHAAAVTGAYLVHSQLRETFGPINKQGNGRTNRFRSRFLSSQEFVDAPMTAVFVHRNSAFHHQLTPFPPIVILLADYVVFA